MGEEQIISPLILKWGFSMLTGARSQLHMRFDHFFHSIVVSIGLWQVGSRSEASGIAKAGAKMVMAVACAKVLAFPLSDVFVIFKKVASLWV